MLISFFVYSDLGFDEGVIFVDEVNFPDGFEHFAGNNVHFLENDRLEVAMDKTSEVLNQLALLLKFDQNRSFHPEEHLLHHENIWIRVLQLFDQQLGLEIFDVQTFHYSEWVYFIQFYLRHFSDQNVEEVNQFQGNRVLLELEGHINMLTNLTDHLLQCFLDLFCANFFIVFFLLGLLGFLTIRIDDVSFGQFLQSTLLSLLEHPVHLVFFYFHDQ
jgi:hypothetical protein